jgi:hypothetical protein
MTMVAFSAAIGATGAIGCTDQSGNTLEPRHVPEVVAQNSSLPASAAASFGPVAALVNDQSELGPTWSRFQFPNEPTVALPDDGVLLFIGTIESGSCPAVVERIAPPSADIAADIMVTIDEQPLEPPSDDELYGCSDDANPVSFVLSLPAQPLNRIYVEHGGRRDSPHSGYVDLEP